MHLALDDDKNKNGTLLLASAVATLLVMLIR